MKQVNQIKDEIQKQAHAIWIASGRQGTAAAGTGFGKSRLAVLEVERMAAAGLLTEADDVLLVVPTEKLRDITWPREFQDWGCLELFQDFVKPICFASLKKEQGKHYKLVILDEIHRLTELNAQAFTSEDEDQLTTFFSENLADAVLGLTATVPDSKREPEKARIISQVAPVVFHYTLDQGVSDGMIADYEIRVIMTPLDNTKKVIDAGTKAKPFKTTEQAHYQFLEKSIRKFQMLASQSTNVKDVENKKKLAMFKTFERNRFIGSLPSKTELARRCLKQITGQGKRTLVFCASIEQCNDLLGMSVYHSKSGSAAFEAFNNQQIDTLGVVNAANEGINFINLNQSLILSLDSNSRNLTQRVGRNLRIREGHKAVIYIVCAQGTVEERWLEKSLEGFDSAKVSYYSSKGVPA